MRGLCAAVIVGICCSPDNDEIARAAKQIICLSIANGRQSKPLVFIPIGQTRRI